MYDPVVRKKFIPSEIEKNYAKEYSLKKDQSDLASQGNLEASSHFIEVGTKCKPCTLTDIHVLYFKRLMQYTADYTAVKIDQF